MAYRILRVEDDSDSGTEQVPPPTGGHLRHAIKCGGVTPTSLDPKTRAAVWADITSPAPNKEWEAEFNWQLAAQASVAGFMGTPPLRIRGNLNGGINGHKGSGRVCISWGWLEQIRPGATERATLAHHPHADLGRWSNQAGSPRRVRRGSLRPLESSQES